jgi:hypothetical protein
MNIHSLKRLLSTLIDVERVISTNLIRSFEWNQFTNIKNELEKDIIKYQDVLHLSNEDIANLKHEIKKTNQ